MRIAPLALFLLLAALAAVAGGASGAEPGAGAPPAPAVPEPAEAPTGKPSAGSTDDIEFEFSSKEAPRYVRDGKAAVLSGSAWVAARGMLLEAENLVVLVEERQVWAEGAVRLTEKRGRLLCSELFYDFRTHRGRGTDIRLEAGGEIESVPQTPGSAERTGQAATDFDVQDLNLGKENEQMRDAWSIGMARTAPSKWYMTAREIRRAGPGRWVLVRPRVTNCSFADPHWCLESSSANYLPGRRVESFNNTLRIGRFPVLYIPYIARDLEHEYPWTTWQFGSSSEWGEYVLSKWGTDLPHGEGWILTPRELFLDADWRRDRGFAYGADLRYDALPHGGGLIDTYFLREETILHEEDEDRLEDALERREIIYRKLRESGAPKISGQPKLRYGENLLFAERRDLDGYSPAELARKFYGEDQRFRLSLQHRQDFFPVSSDLDDRRFYKLDLTTEFEDCSDREILREYFRDEYRSAPPPVSYAMLRSQSDVMSTAVIVQPRVDRFIDQTEYMPELRFDIPDRPLPGGVFLASSGGLGRLFRRFDEDSGFQDFDAGRAQLRLVGSRPFDLGPIAVNPYVGMDQAWYSDHFRGGDVTRGALLYGAESSMSFYGPYGFESERVNIHGLRHVVEPRLYFRGVGDPTHRSREIYDFDERDDLFKENVAGAVLGQKLQARRRLGNGQFQPADLAALEAEFSGYVNREEADRYNDGDMLRPIELRSSVNPTSNLRLWNELEIDAHGVGLSRSTTGAALSVPDRFGLSAGYSSLTPDPDRRIRGSSYLSGRLDLVLGPLYRVSLSSAYEFMNPDEDLGEQGLDNARIELARDLHCWQAAIGFAIEREDEDRRRVFTATLAPTGRPRNLVKGTDMPLLDAPEYSRPPWLARPGESAGALRVLPPTEPPPPPPIVEENEDAKDRD